MRTDQPALRPVEPDHPMLLDGGLAPGDLTLMVRCLCEELLQVGVSAQELGAMSRDPNYQALFAARQLLGDVRMDNLVDEVCRRIGQHRHHTVEHTGHVQAASLTISVSP